MSQSQDTKIYNSEMYEIAVRPLYLQSYIWDWDESLSEEKIPPALPLPKYSDRFTKDYYALNKHIQVQSFKCWCKEHRYLFHIEVQMWRFPELFKAGRI